MTYNTQAPFIASYLIFEKDGKVAFVLRSNTDWMNNHFGLVSGKVEKNESYIAAAIREAKEEAGVTLSEDDLEMVHVVHRHEPSEQAADWVDVYFRVKSWSGDLVNAEPDVHSELAWLDIKNLPDNVISSVVAALNAISLGKAYSEYGWEA